MLNKYKYWLLSIVFSAPAWLFYFNYSPKNLFTLASAITSIFIIHFFISALGVLPALFKTWSSGNKFIFLTCALVAIVLAVGCWPGLVEDDLPQLRSHFFGLVNGWSSVSYSIISHSMILLSQHGIANLPLNLLAYLTVVVLFLQITNWKIKSFIIWPVIIILVYPPTMLFVVSHTRDSLYTLLFMIFILSILLKKYQPTSKFNLSVMQLFFVSILLTDIRQEGKALLVFFPILIVYTYQYDFKKSIKYCIQFYVAAVGLFFVSESLLSANAYNQAYRTTALVNPLSYIIHEKGIDSLSDEQKVNIGAYFDLNKLANNYTLYNIGPFHAGGMNMAGTLDQYKAFQKSTIELILDNPWLFIKNRIVILQTMFGFDSQIFIYNDNLKSKLDLPQKMVNFFRLEVKLEPFNIIQQKFEKLLYYCFTSSPKYLQIFLGTGAVPLLVLLCLSIFYQFDLILSGAASLLLVRTLIVTLLAPAGYYKYIGSIWLGGWLLGFIFLNLYLDRKTKI